MPTIQRIAVVSVHGCPLATPGARSAGGMSVYLRHLSLALGELDVAVDVFTRAHDDTEPRMASLGPRTRVIHVHGGQHGLPKEGVSAHLPAVLAGIRDFAVRGGAAYDLVHSHYWLSGWVGSEFARGLGVPHAVTFHTHGATKEAAFGDKEPAERHAMEAQMAQSASRIIAFTPDEADALQRWYGLPPERTAVVPAGVDCGLFAPGDKHAARQALGLPLEPPVVLYAGRLEAYKAPDIAVRALAHLPGVQLVVVGGGAADAGRAWLCEVAAGAGVAARVHWHDAVPHERLRDYYVAADLLAAPSYHESFGLAPLEAMACGVPVVAAAVGGLRGIIADGETGILVESREPGAYAAHIQALLRDAEHVAAMSRAAVSAAGRYTWSAVAERMLAEYAYVVTA